MKTASILAMTWGLSLPLSVAYASLPVIEIAHPEIYSDVYAISDCHGMLQTAKDLLTANRLIDANGHWSAGRALLVVLGDSIDKGPDSLGVLKLWMALSAEALIQGGRVIHTLGNHEAELLADPDGALTEPLKSELKRLGISAKKWVDPSTTIGGQAYGAFLHSMPVAVRLGNWVFVHAGYFKDGDWDSLKASSTRVFASGNYDDSFLLDEDSPLENKNWWDDVDLRAQYVKNLNLRGIAGVVQGHQPKAFGINGEAGYLNGGALVKIDSGMAPQAGSNPGRLLHVSLPDTLTLLPDASGRIRVPMEQLDASGHSTPLTLGTPAGDEVRKRSLIRKASKTTSAKARLVDLCD